MIRLYVDQPLAPEQTVSLARDQAHYLFSVMRLTPGTRLALINGRDGEFDAVVDAAGKREGRLRVGERLRPLQRPPDLWLLFAPIKKARTDFIVEKAAELGAARILPVQTRFTNSERVRRERLQAHVIEAVEQCGGTFVPEVAEMAKLDTMLSAWPADRNLIFCDETTAGEAQPLGLQPAPSAILIGPEGGFSEEERRRLRAMPQTQTITLGPRVLRADTAAVAALTLWQSRLGDWGFA
ncbi:MAG: 16S rRNA (uracil(1498)-N(3))-methyltransferase [Pseudomonadota bacterium]